MKQTTVIRRVLSGAVAATTAIALAAPPAHAAPVLDAFATKGVGQTLTVQVGLPPAVAGALAPVLDTLDGVLGIDFADGKLSINLSRVLSDLGLTSGADAATANALAQPLTGSLDQLVQTLLGDVVGACGAGVSIPDNPLLTLELLTTDCVEDAANNVSSAVSKVVNLRIGLSRELVTETLGLQPVADLLDEVTATVNEVLGGVLGALQPVLDVVDEFTGITLGELQLESILDVPLVEIGLIESTTSTVREGDVVRSVATTTLADLNILGLVKIVNDTTQQGRITYSSTAYTDGTQAGAGGGFVNPPIRVILASGGDVLTQLLGLVGAESVLDSVELGEGVTLGSVLDSLTEGALSPVLDELLGVLGVSLNAQGAGSFDILNEGRSVRTSTDAFGLRVAPALFAGTPLDGFDVAVLGNFTAANVDIALADVLQAPPAPAPQPEEPVLPKTGAGALAVLIGSLAMGGALLMRRRVV